MRAQFSGWGWGSRTRARRGVGRGQQPGERRMAASSPQLLLLSSRARNATRDGSGYGTVYIDVHHPSEGRTGKQHRRRQMGRGAHPRGTCREVFRGRAPVHVQACLFEKRLPLQMCSSAASVTEVLQRKPRRSGESPHAAPPAGSCTKQQHLCTGPPCLTRLFSLKLPSKMGPEDMPQDKLQLISKPGPCFSGEMLHYPGWKKITPPQGCKRHRAGGAAQHPAAAGPAPASVSNPGRVTPSRGVRVASGKPQQWPQHPANPPREHPQVKTQRQNCGYQVPSQAQSFLQHRKIKATGG